MDNNKAIVTILTGFFITFLSMLVILNIRWYNDHALVNELVKAGTPALVAACAHGTESNSLDCKEVSKGTVK